MKYIVIGPTFPFRGGIAHYTTLLVKYLRERHEVRFFSYRRQYPRLLFPGNTSADRAFADMLATLLASLAACADGAATVVTAKIAATARYQGRIQHVGFRRWRDLTDVGIRHRQGSRLASLQERWPERPCAALEVILRTRLHHAAGWDCHKA